MSASAILVDGFGRIREVVHEVLDGLSADDLAYQVDGTANSIGWLVWHLARVQDDHLAGVGAGGGTQVWHGGGWADRFGLALDPDDTGYGHTPDEVRQVRLDSVDLLLGYVDAVHEQSAAYLGALADTDLGRVVDTRWDPPVTLGVRLVSVLADDLQHAGQAALVRGLLGR